MTTIAMAPATVGRTMATTCSDVYFPSLLLLVPSLLLLVPSVLLLVPSVLLLVPSLLLVVPSLLLVVPSLLLVVPSPLLLVPSLLLLVGWSSTSVTVVGGYISSADVWYTQWVESQIHSLIPVLFNTLNTYTYLTFIVAEFAYAYEIPIGLLL